MTAPPPETDPAPQSGTPFDALPSPLDAVPELRAAARWMIGAFGAVGAALVGGGPLVAVGKVHGLGDASVAGAALLLALAGVSLAVWQVSRVLVPPVTTTATLASPAVRGLREMIDAAPADFFGATATGVDDLLRHRAVAANLQRMVAAETDPDRRELLRHHLGRAQANVRRTEPFVRWLLAMAHVWQIRAALHTARRWCLLAVLLVAAGAVAFLTVTGRDTAQAPAGGAGAGADVTAVVDSPRAPVPAGARRAVPGPAARGYRDRSPGRLSSSSSSSRIRVESSSRPVRYAALPTMWAATGVVVIW
ncbi:hypothetical protein GCM10010129_42870 [Streptomyces fumigatiscleroticus]|nr:hypothetical protein GCM10010129_42870 [Streptomyces fumigatiscleroticus]